jgi:hypothetical protein
MHPIKGDGFMRIRKRAGGALFVVTAAAVAIGLGATAALATSATLTAKVTNGGTYTGTSSNTVLTDNGVSVTCTSSTASGTIPTKTYTNATTPITVGTSAKLSFSGCTGPLGKVTVKVTKLPYKVQADSKTNSKGQTDGMVAGANTAVSMTGCSFTVTGSAPGYYTNSGHTLTLTPTPPGTPLDKAQLTISGVSGCSGLVHNGDHPAYTATYKISRAIVIKAS